MSDSMTAYAWAWAENQVLVAMKTVPIGQSAGQRILWAVGAEIEEVTCGCDDSMRARLDSRRACAVDAATRSNFAPGLAILSSQHETQYSRLFRS
jgi:urease accessory protein